VLSTLIGYLLLYAFLLVFYILTLMHMSSKPARSLKEGMDFAAPSTGTPGSAATLGAL